MTTTQITAKQRAKKKLKAARRRWHTERKQALAAGKTFAEPAPKKPAALMQRFSIGRLG